MVLDPKQRFSSRVQDYVKYRPHYPSDLLAFLCQTIGLDEKSIVADVGSGTGILTRSLLEIGCAVYAVEPNREMREAADSLLGSYHGFHSIDGSAEATGLESGFADVVTAAQAFHWFDAWQARAEFRRILKPGRNVVLIWNERKTDTPFLKAYEAALREHVCDYAQVDHRNVDENRLRAFFGPAGYRVETFPNAQRFDWDGLYGRSMSASYVPAEGHPKHPEFLAALRECFEQYANDGNVVFEYDTRVFYGPLSGG